MSEWAEDKNSTYVAICWINIFIQQIIILVALQEASCFRIPAGNAYEAS